MVSCWKQETRAFSSGTEMLSSGQLTLSPGTEISPFYPGHSCLLRGTPEYSMQLWVKLARDITHSCYIHSLFKMTYLAIFPPLNTLFCGFFWFCFCFSWTTLLLFPYVPIFFFMSLLNPIHSQAIDYYFYLLALIETLFFSETPFPWSFLQWRLFFL